MSSQSAPTRTLPHKPSLAQLRKQAKELLKSYRAGKEAAVAEVERFERSPDPAHFALADAQRVLARAYGFSSWPALKNHVEGVNFAALLAAVEAGDVAAVRPQVGHSGSLPCAAGTKSPSCCWAAAPTKRGHHEIVQLLRSAGAGGA